MIPLKVDLDIWASGPVCARRYQRNAAQNKWGTDSPIWDTKRLFSPKSVFSTLLSLQTEYTNIMLGGAIVRNLAKGYQKIVATRCQAMGTCLLLL